jgi:hypothetical protein
MLVCVLTLNSPGADILKECRRSSSYNDMTVLPVSIQSIDKETTIAILSNLEEYLSDLSASGLHGKEYTLDIPVKAPSQLPGPSLLPAAAVEVLKISAAFSALTLKAVPDPELNTIALVNFPVL